MHSATPPHILPVRAASWLSAWRPSLHSFSALRAYITAGMPNGKNTMAERIRGNGYQVIGLWLSASFSSGCVSATWCATSVPEFSGFSCGASLRCRLVPAAAVLPAVSLVPRDACGRRAAGGNACICRPHPWPAPSHPYLCTIHNCRDAVLPLPAPLLSTVLSVFLSITAKYFIVTGFYLSSCSRK